MLGDMFCSSSAKRMLLGKCIYFFGDSNIRALYKDLLWLLESGPFISEIALKTKNEKSFANDVRVSNGTLHGGRNYVEVREYQENPYIKFQFITRLFSQEFIDTIMNVNHVPDFIIIGSCVWDMSRWGANGVQQYKMNLYNTFDFLKTHLPNTSRIIFLTSFPPSYKSQGGFLTREIEFLNKTLPWQITFANMYAKILATGFGIDILDLHHYFRFLSDYHTNDGIHWTPLGMRFATNLLLTQIASSVEFSLPNNLLVDGLVLNSQTIFVKPAKQPAIKSSELSNMHTNCIEAFVKNAESNNQLLVCHRMIIDFWRNIRLNVKLANNFNTDIKNSKSSYKSNKKKDEGRRKLNRNKRL